MIPENVKIQQGVLPDLPGVYLMKDAEERVIYVGKATSLKRRVSSYFQKPHDTRIQEMVSNIHSIEYVVQPTAIEALILEANLIKHFYPPYNVLAKDDKSFLYLVITKEEFPKPLLIRGGDMGDDASKKYKAVFGPYTSGTSLRAALEIIRKIIPWSICEPGAKRACFYYHLKQCPGVCIGAITKSEYAKIIRDLIRFFEGKKDQLLKQYKKVMVKAAKEKEFEKAADYRNRIFALEHIQDIAVIRRDDDEMQERPQSLAVNIFGRIEGYDISNTSGTSSVASMVVFESGAPSKADYRKFRIKTVQGSNDVASMQEVLRRRFAHNWRRPDLVLIDGGWPQVNAVQKVFEELGIMIPIVGLAKGAQRKRDDIVSTAPQQILEIYNKYLPILIRVRDEAHRFAITYHKTVRSNKMLGKNKKPT